MGQRSFFPLTGAVFAILFIVLFLIEGDVPDADDPAQEVVAYYADNEAKVMLGGILLAIGSIFFLFFVGYLRSVLRMVEGGAGTLSSIAAGGGIIATTGMLIFAGFSFVLSQSTDGLDPAIVQTVNALNANFFFPLAGGIVAFLFATGLVAVRTGVLPSWLGWAAIVIAVAGFTPVGFIAFLLSILWVLITSIVLWTRQAPATATPTV